MHRELTYADTAFGRVSHVGLYLTTALLVALVALDLAPTLFGVDWPRTAYGVRFALVAAVLGGARALYAAVVSLIEGRTGADLALAVACVAAILLGEPLVAAEVVVIGLVGECLEAWTFARTQSAVRGLTELFPQRCWLLRDGQEVRVFTRDVGMGDYVVVKPGAKVPVDGDVTDGRSAVDTSALTGESVPADKGPGDFVLAGSVNQTGALTVRAKSVGEQTAAGRTIELTAQALRDKGRGERTADRLARWFLPVVLALAAATFLAYWAGERNVRRAAYPALTVLVVSCPCALILATPAAVVAALGRLAGTGVLVKSGAALERLAGLTAFAFDKTGTLTEGKLELGDVVPFTVLRDELLAVAAAAEAASEHPIAAAIRRAVASPESASAFEALPGAGVRATVAGRAVLVGTPRLLAENGVEVPPDAARAVERLSSNGQTPLVVARDRVVLGVIGTRDRVRPGVAAVLADLRTAGVHRFALLTGDRAAVAAAVAAAVGIPDVRAELLPAEKAEAVGDAAFVGDGLNDAPALARSAVGLAVGQGAEIAAEAGDIVLMGDPLKHLPLLVRLSRETVRVIRQNVLVFAFGVNLVGVVATAWLWPLFAPAGEWAEAGPLAGAVYHQFGSLAVLLNSMRLLAFERQPKFERTRDRLRVVDRWLDFDGWLHALEHRWRTAAACAACAGCAAWVVSGLTPVAADEIGVVSRCGRLLADDLEPGLHWRWPWPFEEVLRLQPERVRAVEIGFRSRSNASGALTWESLHADGFARIPDEAAMLTGDGNLVELLASVRYRVADKHTFLTASRDPDAHLHAVAEAALREEAAGRPFAELLTTDRVAFADAVRRRLEPSADALGLALDAVVLHDLHPPAEVVSAYRDVARAAEGRDRRVHEAEAAAIRTRRDAEVKAQTSVRQAEALAADTVARASAAADTFAAWHETFSAESSSTGIRQMIEMRLAWEALTDALAGRPKAIVDADKLPGRRQLYLLEPLLPSPPRPEAPKP